jgi:hypothetical protein
MDYLDFWHSVVKAGFKGPVLRAHPVGPIRRA